MSDWKVKPSSHSLNTRNPIREAVVNIKVPENFPKKTYSLALGDPTVFAGFEPHPSCVAAVREKLEEGKGNGYTLSNGTLSTRQFLANHYSNDKHSLTPSDVIIDIGGTGALHTAMTAMLSQGDNFLIPSPGFPLYVTIAGNIGAEARVYNLLPHANWELDIQQCESLVDENTKFIVVVNPSNPCGSVWTRQHQEAIIDFARRHRLVILSDEVYEHMTFGAKFYSFGELDEDVPVIVVSALSKVYLVPGWRVGWCVVFDKHSRLSEVKDAMMRIKNMLLHPPPFIADAIPQIFTSVPKEWLEGIMNKVQQHADLVFNKVKGIPTLYMNMPEGSLYSIIQVDTTQFKDIPTSLAFAEKLAQEQGVVVLPTECFLSSGGFRIVLCNPPEVLNECLDRIHEFILNHLSN